MNATFAAHVAEVRRRTFPLTLGNGVTAELSDWATVQSLFQQHQPAVFPDSFGGPRFVAPPERGEALARVRNNFIDSTHIDCVVFKQGSDVVGWYFGEQTDPSTYYMRNTGIVPASQGRGIYSAFLPPFLAYLRALGYERVTSQHKGHNRRVLIAKLKAGFIVSGLDLDERFGPLVRLTAFLHADRHESAVRQMS